MKKTLTTTLLICVLIITTLTTIGCKTIIAPSLDNYTNFFEAEGYDVDYYSEHNLSLLFVGGSIFGGLPLRELQLSGGLFITKSSTGITFPETLFVLEAPDEATALLGLKHINIKLDEADTHNILEAYTNSNFIIYGSHKEIQLSKKL